MNCIPGLFTGVLNRFFLLALLDAVVVEEAAVVLVDMLDKLGWRKLEKAEPMEALDLLVKPLGLLLVKLRLRRGDPSFLYSENTELLTEVSSFVVGTDDATTEGGIFCSVAAMMSMPSLSDAERWCNRILAFGSRSSDLLCRFCSTNSS